MDFTLLKEQISIQDFISHFIPKAKHHSTICCPFHEENTPSFSISNDLKLAKCFGTCNTTWDIYSFYREYVEDDHYSFINHLKDVYNIDFSTAQQSQINIDITHYKQQLTSDHIQYLTGRGISLQTIKRYNIGYSSLGQFAGRLTIPIKSGNEFIGFTCRKYDKDLIGPKYILSSKSDGLSKSLILGNITKDTSHALIFEGYMDILSYASYPSKQQKYQPVCVFGCNISSKQLSRLSLVPNITLCLDTSPSGCSGTLKACLALLQSRYYYNKINVMVWEDKGIKDFNELVIKYKNKWIDYVNIINVIEWTSNTLSDGLSGIEIEEVVQSLKSIKNNFVNARAYTKLLTLLHDRINRSSIN